MTLRTWTNERILATIKEYAINGVVASTGLDTLQTVARRTFGSWAKACKAAGLRASRDVVQHDMCIIESCINKTRSRTSPHCEKHYYRLRRNGHTALLERKPKSRIPHSGGYIKLYSPDHPLTRLPDIYVYEHRAVYYDAHGEGPFTCHWCGKMVTWDDMNVDHLNDVRDDNREDNLVASCPPCNVKRGEHKSKQAQRARGVLLTLHGETMCVSEWAARIGVSPGSIALRLKKGWPIERALTEPRGKFGPTQGARPGSMDDGANDEKATFATAPDGAQSL